MFDLTLEQGSRLVTMIIVLAVAVGLAGALYYLTFRRLRPWQWAILLVLRCAAIAIVVLLLFRPVVAFRKEQQERPHLAFLLDRSRSMSIADDVSGVTRFNLARQQIEKWWERLKDDFQLHLIEFADHARILDDVEQMAPLAPDGPATSICRALDECPKCAPGQQLGAVILLSDGNHNTARNPADLAAKMATTIHTVGVGASLRSNAVHRDIQVASVDCPDRLMLNNKAKITAGIEGIGLGGHVCKVILEDNGQPLLDQELTLDDVEGPQKVEFEFLPSVKGRHTYTVRVPPANGEKIVENNQRSAVSLVIEPGIRLLYLEGTLRAEYGTLVQRFLSKDPDIEFCSLIQTRRNQFSRRTNMPNLELNVIPSKPEEVAKFDVFIIGDIDSTYFKPEQQELIVNRVKDGAGLIMLGGYHSLGPGGYDGSPIGGVLPVRLGRREIGQMTDAFVPALTPEGVGHPIFSNVVGYFPTRQSPAKIAGLPPLDGCTRVEAARPGAAVLAVYLSEAGTMPVLAVQPVGKGRAAVFAADTTWKWQQVPRAMGQDTPFLQFWGQVVRWLAGRSTEVKNEANVTAATDKGFYDPDETMQLSAIVRDQKGEGTNKAQVEAHIADPAGKVDTVALSIVPGPEGHYSGRFDPKGAGSYKIMIVATVEGTPVRCEPLSVEVGRPNLEFESLDLDDKMLSRIAAEAKGRYVHISMADHLVDQIDKTQRKKQLYYERRLYSPSWCWAAFVFALSLEWFLRKKFRLR